MSSHELLALELYRLFDSVRRAEPQFTLLSRDDLDDFTGVITVMEVLVLASRREPAWLESFATALEKSLSGDDARTVHELLDNLLAAVRPEASTAAEVMAAQKGFGKRGFGHAG